MEDAIILFDDPGNLCFGCSPHNERGMRLVWRRCGGREVERMHGRSLVGVLAGTRDEVYGAEDFVGGEMQNGKWMRQGDFKAASVAPPYGSGTWQLYDLSKDPGETRDLAKEKPEILKRLQAAWDSYAEDVGVVLTEHLYKAAERNKADAVFRFAGGPFAADGEAQQAVTRLIVFFRKDLRQYSKANACFCSLYAEEDWRHED